MCWAAARPTAQALSLKRALGRFWGALDSVGFDRSIATGSRQRIAEAGFGQILRKQMNVRPQREARIRVAKELLHLHGIPAAAKQHGRAGVPETMKTRPIANTYRSRCRLEHARRDVVRVDAETAR